MLRRVTNFVRGWWHAWRPSALLRTAPPVFGEITRDPAPRKDSGEPTALDDLEAFIRETYGPQASVRRLMKLDDSDVEVVLNVEQHDRVVRVRRVGRKWTNAPRSE